MAGGGSMVLSFSVNGARVASGSVAWPATVPKLDRSAWFGIASAAVHARPAAGRSAVGDRRRLIF